MYRFPPDASGSIDFDTATIEGVLAVVNGGTEADNATDARTNLSAAKSGANSDITSLSGLTTPLSASQGGTGAVNFNVLSALAGQRLSQIIAPANSTSIQTIGSQNGMSVAGTAAVAMESDGQYVSYTSAATSGTNNGWTGGSSSSIHPCGTNRDLRGEGVFVFKTGSDVTNVRYYIGFTSNSGLLTNGPTAYHVAVFGYDTAVDGTAFWRVVTMDGVTQNRVVTTIPVATNTRYVFRVRLNSGSVEFFDDTSGWAASPTVTAQTANLPTSSQIMGTIMGNRTLANESKVIKCSSITVLSK
jgi:hypothetical protein